MNIDTEAAEILNEFSEARRIALGNFFRRYGTKAKWLLTSDANAIIAERLVIYAGLMPTNHISGRDADHGQLPLWREVASVKPDPYASLKSLLVRKLTDDLFDAVFRTNGIWKPMGLLSLDIFLDDNGWEPAEKNGWEKDWEESYPIATAIYRDGETIQSLKRVLHRGKDGIRRQLHAEMAELRMELA